MEEKFGAFSLFILEAEHSILIIPPSSLLVREFHQDEDGDPVRAGPGESCQRLAGERGLLVASAPRGNAQGPVPGGIRGSRSRPVCAGASAVGKRSRVRMLPFQLRCIHNGTYQSKQNFPSDGTVFCRDPHREGSPWMEN